MNKAIILLSGGLDSLVALGYLKLGNKYDVKRALTFDYGQKSVNKEIEASSKICEYYGIEHSIIKLDWLKDITKTSLVSNDEIPIENLHTKESAKSVWVPNRNALFINIAASFCDSFGYNYIIYGANKDEAGNFPDNTEEFRSQISELFKTSDWWKNLLEGECGSQCEVIVEEAECFDIAWKEWFESGHEFGVRDKEFLDKGLYKILNFILIYIKIKD